MSYILIIIYVANVDILLIQVIFVNINKIKIKKKLEIIKIFKIRQIIIKIEIDTCLFI